MKQTKATIWIMFALALIVVLIGQGTLFDITGVQLTDGFTKIGSDIKLTDYTEGVKLWNSRYWNGAESTSALSTDQNLDFASQCVLYTEPLGEKKIRFDIESTVTSTPSNANAIWGGIGIDTINTPAIILPSQFTSGGAAFANSIIGNLWKWSGTGVNKVMVEIAPSSFSNDYTVSVGGITQGTFSDIEAKYIQICSAISGGNAQIKNLRYQPLLSCEKDSTDISAKQAFVGGTKFNLNDIRYPVKQFCFSHPLEIYKGDSSGIDSSYTIYNKLINGFDVTVPDDEVWLIHYVFDNSLGLANIFCEEGSELNENGVCEKQSGLIYVLSQGELHNDGTFTIEPQTICESAQYDGRWVEETKLCILEQPIIDYGSELRVSTICKNSNMIYDSDNKRCVSPVTVNPITGKIKIPYSYKNLLLIAIVAIVSLYALWRLLKR